MSQPANPRLPLAGVRVLAVEQYGAGPFGTLVPRRPRRRGDQDREPQRRRRRRPPGRAALLRRRATATSSRPSTATRSSVTLDLKHPEGKAAFQRAGRRPPTQCSTTCAATCRTKLGLDLRAPEGREPAHRLRAPLGLRPQRLAQGLAGLRLPDAGRGRPHVAHRRAGQPADALRPVDRRPDDRPRRGFRPARGRA